MTPSASTTAVSALPFKRLSLFYALYFALLGCIAPYWGLFLAHRGFDANDIGSLMALFGLVRILAPNAWAYLGRRHHSPLPMIRWAGMLTLVCFSAVAWADSFAAMAAVMLGYGFFWAAMLPQYEALTLQAVASRMELYGQIRVWGSVGFIVAVVALGALLQHLSMDWLPLMMWLFMLIIWLNAWCLSASASAMSRGFILAALARTIAALVAISPWAASRGGSTATLS